MVVDADDDVFYDNESNNVAADNYGKTNTWHSLADLALKSIIVPSSLSAAVYLIKTTGMLEYLDFIIGKFKITGSYQ